jgi:hypothetical protein
LKKAAGTAARIVATRPDRDGKTSASVARPPRENRPAKSAGRVTKSRAFQNQLSTQSRKNESGVC